MIWKQLRGILSVAAAFLAAASTTGAFQGVPLQGTEWKLTHLGGQALTLSVDQKPPSLLLQRDPSRFSGSGGCNQIMGTYRTKSASITFGPAAGTRMACPSGMDTEAAFISALERVKRWHITGRVLDLLDGGDQVVARLEAPTPPAEFVNRLWRVEKSSGVATGTLYVFLSDGTLLVTSANTSPLIGAWKDNGGALTMVEDGLSYKVDILTLTADRFVIRSHHPRGSLDIALVPAARARPK